MAYWNFTVLLNQPLTPEQADAFDNCDAFADGSASYVLGSQEPEKYPVRADDAELKKLTCGLEAPTLVDAIAQMVDRIRLIPGLRAIGVEHDDLVTLDEAAQRCNRTTESLTQLSREASGSGGFPVPESGDEDCIFYSWQKVAAFLRSLGDDIPHVAPDIAIADHALRLAEALRGAEVPPGALRALGLGDLFT